MKVDNRNGEDHVALSDLQQIGNRSLEDLVSESPEVLVFPDELPANDDPLGKQPIFSTYGDILTTYSIIGFVGMNDTELTISSRFDESGGDYFLHYMLKEVLSLNILDLPHGSEWHSIYDFLPYLLPHYLKAVNRQGMYKEYRRFRRDDMRVRGPIDIPRHIVKNVPFSGRLSYTTREQSYDNRVTQLVRHTIEYVGSKPHIGKALARQRDTTAAIEQIIAATPSYTPQTRERVLADNLRPVSHPYFTEYEPLRKLCVQILRREQLAYGASPETMYGLVIDGAWLWEEYLDKLLGPRGLLHPQNRTATGGVPVFQQSTKYWRYPDFYSEEKGLVLDAKYKRLNGAAGRIGREDLHQLVTYMYILRATNGVLIHPFSSDASEPALHHVGALNGYRPGPGGEPATILTAGFPVPRDEDDFGRYCERMEQAEAVFGDTIDSLGIANEVG